MGWIPIEKDGNGGVGGGGGGLAIFPSISQEGSVAAEDQVRRNRFWAERLRFDRKQQKRCEESVLSQSGGATC